MKAKMEASCVERESKRAVAVLLDGGVSKKSSKKNTEGAHGRRGEENSEEMQKYLRRLQELVPFMPKNKRPSKLEVISHTIDYIHDLRETLGLPPCQQSETQCYSDNEEYHTTISDDNFSSDSNQTFKMSLVQENSSSTTSHNSESSCDTPTTTNIPLQRLPLSSISTPRNTDAVTNVTNGDDEGRSSANIDSSSNST